MRLTFSIKNIKKYISLLLIISLSSSLIGCNATNPFNNVNDFSVANSFFDTIIKITIYDNSKTHADELLKECTNMCSYYENLFNASITTSDIYRINHSAGKTTDVSLETIELINSSLYYSNISDGMFDPTIYTVSRLWDFHDINNPPPPQKDIEAALNHVDYKNVVIDESNLTVTLIDSAASIDIGGIAKGYIADKLCEYLSEMAITGAIINIGGDISTLGNKGIDSFTIGVFDPIKNATTIGVNISDMSIATSGTYERMIQYNGTTYHHILDPATGYSSKSDLISATIITKKAIDADALCTIAILIGSEDTLTLINSIPDTECILIKQNGSYLYSDNAKHLLSS